MAKTVLVVLAEGFEEVEAVTPADVLRRAGADVVIAGVGGRAIRGAHGIRIETDIALEDYRGLPDAVVLPGGQPGADNLCKSAKLTALLADMHAQERMIAAICASPAVVLAPLGILDNRSATCFPGYEKEIGSRGKFSEDRVVCAGHVITSRGPGTALEFSLELARRLAGKTKADALASAMLAQA